MVVFFINLTRCPLRRDAAGTRLTAFLGDQSAAMPPRCAAERNGLGRGVANLPAHESPDSLRDPWEFALPLSLAHRLDLLVQRHLRLPASAPAGLPPPHAHRGSRRAAALPATYRAPNHPRWHHATLPAPSCVPLHSDLCALPPTTHAAHLSRRSASSTHPNNPVARPDQTALHSSPRK